MAPKAPKPKKKATVTPIVPPFVPDEELKKAQQMLSDAEERKKARSSMVHYLNSTGQKAAYDIA
eukprot:5368564-Pyramimonas_sp.AAC.1